MWLWPVPRYAIYLVASIFACAEGW
jgi:hypothetical protein